MFIKAVTKNLKHVSSLEGEKNECVVAWLLFGENLTYFRFFGILLICSGVFLIVLKI